MKPLTHAMRATLATAMLIALSASHAWSLQASRMILGNGAVLLVSEQHELPLVTMKIAFDAGSRRDPAGKEGLADLTAHSLMQGTSKLNAAQFMEKADFLGSHIRVDGDFDYATASFQSLKEFQNDTLKLLVAILQDPGLRDTDIIRKRDEQVADLNAYQQFPSYVARLAFLQALYGDEPYGHLPMGTPESVAKLTPADVRTFYHTYYKVGSAVIVVVGDVDSDQIRAELEAELTGLRGTVAPQEVPPSPRLADGVHLKLINRDVVQANLIAGFGGVERSNPDFYKLQVMNYLLGGGGFASRLVNAVRVNAGLAYSIASSFGVGKLPSTFTVNLETRNPSANQALGLIVQQLHEIQDHPVSDAELESARKSLIDVFPLNFQNQYSTSRVLLDEEIYDLGLDYVDKYPQYIRSVTKADVQEVAKKYLHPDALLVVAVANQKQANINLPRLETEASGK
ncbi:MAG: M16 family metallopeptidase [Candidatus Binataceae bacterium]